MNALLTAALSSTLLLALAAGTSTNGSNDLSKEKSPYLVQHASNPVQWHPWNDRALADAQKQNKLIFLSIGYSTCHWCHVMERESFIATDVAEQLNANFIPISVDREERPDLDALYFEAVERMTGTAGWPLNLILTPDLKPVFGSTYLSKEKFLEALRKTAQTWKSSPDRLVTDAEELSIEMMNNQSAGIALHLTNEVFINFFEQFRENFDTSNGGLRAKQKLPIANEIRLLLRIHRRSGSPSALEMAQRTLDEMARGGIYDHIGGGFHRYSVTASWLKPHFEKMLYDQAAMALAYLEAFQDTGENEYRLVAQETLDYVLRDLTSKEGAFYSAEDADSEGVEGKFYVWTQKEVKAALSSAEFAEFAKAYHVIDTSNFENGTRILTQLPEFSRSRRSPVLKSALEKLLKLRSSRPRPLRDEKIITSWNGLAISAMARAGRALKEPRYVQAAAQAADFILTHNTSKGADSLLHRFVAGEAKYSGFLEDYAYFIEGLIDLYEATFDPRWLLQAKSLQEAQNRLFGDPKKGGYYFTNSKDQSTGSRRKPYADVGNTPSGNSVAALNLLRLADLFADPAFRRSGEKTLSSSPATLTSSPLSFARFLMALDYALDRSKAIAILSDAPQTVELGLFLNPFNPNLVLAAGLPNDQKLPILKNRPLKNGKTTFYVCVKNACKLPTNDIEAAARIAGDSSRYVIHEK